MKFHLKIIIIFNVVSLLGCTQKPFLITSESDSLKSDAEWKIKSTESYLNKHDVNIEKYSYLNGKPYPVDTNGNVVISKTELKLLHDQGAQQFFPSNDGVVLSSNELNVLMQDKEAFFAYTKNPEFNAQKESVFVLQKGSLKSNLIRLAEKKGVNKIFWEPDFDFYVPTNKIIKANSFSIIISQILEDFNIAFQYTDANTILSTIRFYERGKRNDIFSFTLLEGSFQENFIRLSKLANWGRRWEIDHDFHIAVTETIYGKSYKDILNTILLNNNLPIEAEVQ